MSEIIKKYPSRAYKTPCLELSRYEFFDHGNIFDARKIVEKQFAFLLKWSFLCYLFTIKDFVKYYSLND